MGDDNNRSVFESYYSSPEYIARLVEPAPRTHRATKKLLNRLTGGNLEEYPAPQVHHRWVRCECCGEGEQARLCRHHFVPRAVGGRDRDVVTLCDHCHELAHAMWGPGNDYRGPRNARDTIRALSIAFALLHEAGQADQIASETINGIWAFVAEQTGGEFSSAEDMLGEAAGSQRP